MAYKYNHGTFQLGNADSSNDSLQFTDVITVNADANAEVKGLDFQISGDLEPGGLLDGTALAVFNSDGNLTNKQELFTIQDSSDNNLVRARWKHDAGDAGAGNSQIQFYKDGSNRMSLDGSVQTGGVDAKLQLRNANDQETILVRGDKITTAAGLNGSTGHITTTGNVSINGTNGQEAFFIVTGSLDVNGSLVDFDTEEVYVKNKILHIDSGAAHDHLDASLIIGPVSADGAMLKYKQLSVAGSPRALSLEQGSGGAALNVAARRYVGDGSALTNMPASFVKNSYSRNFTEFDTDADGSLELGINIVIGPNGGFGASRTFTLPANPVEGDLIRVINFVSNSSNTIKTIISKAGSQTIEGVNTIELVSPDASVDLVYYDTDSWMVL